jgi:hypothetical protein
MDVVFYQQEGSMGKEERQMKILDRYRTVMESFNFTNMNMKNFASSTQATEEALLASQVELQLLEKEYLPQVYRVAPLVIGGAGIASLLILREIFKELR